MQALVQGDDAHHKWTRSLYKLFDLDGCGVWEKGCEYLSQANQMNSLNYLYLRNILIMQVAIRFIHPLEVISQLELSIWTSSKNDSDSIIWFLLSILKMITLTNLLDSYP